MQQIERTGSRRVSRMSDLKVDLDVVVDAVGANGSMAGIVYHPR
jgi:hypothetical protein